MQGTDPKDYYAEHPIKNKVETRTGRIWCISRRGDAPAGR